jgi:hypothetical protein
VEGADEELDWPSAGLDTAQVTKKAAGKTPKRTI